MFTIPSLLEKFGSELQTVEKSIDNHFMYYNARKSVDDELLAGWRPPTEEVRLSFGQYLRLAMAAEETRDAVSVASMPLHYLEIDVAEGARTPWLVEVLPFFTSHLQGRPSFMIVDPSGFKGVNCRYGMCGVTAAAHYDGQWNMVAMLRGRKRYVLLPPNACDELSVLPLGHPPMRHSLIDWSELLPAPNRKAGRRQLRHQEPGRVTDGVGIGQRRTDIFAFCCARHGVRAFSRRSAVLLVSLHRQPTRICAMQRTQRSEQ